MSYYNGQQQPPGPGQQQPYYDPKQPLKDPQSPPPAYYDPNPYAAPQYFPTASNPPQPYNEQPPLTLNTAAPVVMISPNTAPKHTSPIPHYPYMEGVVDIIPPTYMVSPISRDILSNAQPIPYTKDLYDSDDDKTSCPSCCDMCLGIMGLLGIGLLAAFVIVTVTAGFGVQIIALVFSIPLIIVYMCSFIFCSYLCCCACDNRNSDQACLRAPYYTAIFRGKDSSQQSIQDSIAHLQNDVPQLEFNVVASHQTGSGKNRRTVVTYNQTHVVPILHAKFVGTTSNQFLSALDDFVSGDVAIQFIPRLVLHPDQHDYILRFREMVYQCNKHRDVTVRITPFIKCYDPSDQTPAVTSGYLTEEVKFVDPSKTLHDDDVEMMYAGDSDREVGFRRKAVGDEEGKSSLLLNLATSLGNKTEIYHSNGRSASPILKFFTSQCCWVLGMLSCFATCLMCCWHCRFTGARYHATYHVLFPRYEDLAGAYNNNMEQFHTKPPSIQPQQMPMGQQQYQA